LLPFDAWAAPLDFFNLVKLGDPRLSGPQVVFGSKLCQVRSINCRFERGSRIRRRGARKRRLRDLHHGLCVLKDIDAKRVKNDVGEQMSGVKPHGLRVPAEIAKCTLKVEPCVTRIVHLVVAV
jgi:hypothetical protein